MNCTTCRFELSQCLDGRLPSGRRTVVMQHVESCESCAEFWHELQAAQALTEKLQATTVSGDFRDSLWQRINAGEGTPYAALRDAVPMWTKVRYTMSGAAAAAALLIGLTFLKNDEQPNATTNNLAKVDSVTVPSAPPAGTSANVHLQPRQRQEAPMMSRMPNSTLATDNRWATNPLPANRLSYQLVAVETARQLEQRHANVSAALRMLDNPANDRSIAIANALDNAREFHAFGELLLDMRDRGRLVFTDSEVDTDLRVAVKMLARTPANTDNGLMTIETLVQPALSSTRLGTVSQTIAMRPVTNPYEEQHALLRLNTQRPEIFPKLFFVIGNDSGYAAQVFPGTVFFMEDMCGPSWVAPRSEVDSHGSRLRMMSRQFGEGGIRIEAGTPPSRKKD